ncbi:zinc finger protein 83-like [Wyeomyia smithii]|uniref:zinc finger protein 83-like n=1 Tax=Wyeomyia smithii TaxID=174621 RepID=UPI0024682176|nr:zinc finger protein 83-like [Wyeomyia smithii]
MNLKKICRMCLSEKTRVKSIFKNYKRERLLVIITEVVQLEVNENDGLPVNICKPCASTLIRIQNNIQEFRDNERKLREKMDKLRSRLKPVEEEKEGTILIKQDPLNDSSECNTITENLGVYIKLDFPESINSTLTDNSNSEQLQFDRFIDMTSDDFISVEHEPGIGSNFSTGQSNALTDDAQSNLQCGEESRPMQNLPKVSLTVRDRAREPKIKRKRRRRFDDDDESRPKVNDHKCYICRSESMGSAKALLEHLTVHLDRTPYTCTECQMDTIVLKSVRSLNVHLKMHAQPMKCEYCDRRYCDERARDYHVKTYHLGESAPCPSTCEQCGKVCKSISALKSHMRDHRLSLKCEYCEKIFHRRNKLKEHVTRVHEKAEKYECNLCHRVVHSLESYNSHLKMHMSEKTYECDLCPMKFYTAGNLGLHKRIHSGNANYKPHKDWSGHYTVHQEPNQDKIYTCKLCGKSYTKTVMKINNHLKNHFKEIKCDRCDLKFVNESQLKTHYVVHTGIRQYKCEFCGKDFLHKNNLTQHLKLHRNEQNFACEFCGKLFTYKEGMKAHIRNHHLRESPYECVICRKKFVDNASLVRHTIAEHEEPPKQVDLGPPPLMGLAPPSGQSSKFDCTMVASQSETFLLG